MSRRNEIIFYIFYITGVILIGITLGEFYCRKSGICPLSNFRSQSYPNNELFITSDFLPFELAPNIPNFSNSLGMRDKERNIQKPENVFRIIVLGDSITMFGQYTFFLEDLLHKDFGDKVEVWNCSIGGQGIREYYLNLKYRCLTYQPDMVIIGFCLNDLEVTPVMVKDKNGNLLCYRPFQLIKSRFDTWLFFHSNLYRLVMACLENQQAAYSLRPESSGRLYLGKIKDLTQEHKIPFLTLIFPYFKYDSEEMSDYKAIKKINDELNVEYIDLHRVFEKKNRYKFLNGSHNDYIHPNILAHRIIAHILRQYLIKKNIIQKSRIHLKPA